MAKSKDNVVMFGASGKIGKMLVFRQRADQTIIARRPKKSTKEITQQQMEVRNNFTEAAYYAKAAIADPILKQAYLDKARPGQTAYNVAFADYLKAPELRQVFLENYSGQIGDKLLFRIIDNFEVKSVNIQLFDSNNVILEQGFAEVQANKMDWVYTTIALNPNISGSRLKISITDTPNNVLQVEQTIT